ncbi:MAG: hypothetical protein PHV30_03095 [Candidatus Margulisbacteria bacterium]|nr:hypothetical protein [Candidatus Margulisiibacteriota bacterium]
MNELLNVENKQLNQAQTAKSTDKQFEDKINNYLKSTGRDSIPPQDIKQNLGLLKAQQLTIKDFCKNLLNSTNTNDLNTIKTTAEELHFDFIMDKTQLTNKTDIKNNSPLQNAAQSKNIETQNNLNFQAQINIVQAKVGDQVLSGQIINLINNGKPKEALAQLGNRVDLLEGMLESLIKMNQLSTQQLQSVLAFIQEAITVFTPQLPELAEQIKKQYDRFRKKIEENDKSASVEDSSEISNEAQEFINEFKSVTSKLNQWDGKMPQDMAESYDQLLSLLGFAE